MFSTTSPKLTAFHLKTLSAALASAMLFSNAQAAGLGELTVLSALGQPLRAEVELILNAKDDDGSLQVRLASYDAFRQANIEFNSALPSLRFAIEHRGDKRIVRVTSVQPMNEPFIDMLLELGSSQGRVVREYVFLLDPASLYPAQAAPQAVNAPAAKPVEQTRAANKRAEPVAAAPAKAEFKPKDKPATPAPASGKPRLTLSGARPLSGAGIGMEEYAAMEKSVIEANARVKTLEQKVGDMQKLLEVTNSLLEELRKQNALAKSAPALAASAAVAPAAADIKPPVLPPAAIPAPAKPAPAAPPADTGLSDLFPLPAAGLLAALLGVFGIYAFRRRKKRKLPAADLFANPIRETEPVPAAGVAAIDAGNSVSIGAPVPPTAPGNNDEVDVVSEADVYIAFGRDVQAEQVLKDALRTQPQRHAARVKLLTIYAARKDVQAFDALAGELYAMTKGEGAEWRQAATMGLEIDPGNPLYAAAKPASLAPASAIIELLDLPSSDAVPAMPALEPVPEETDVPEAPQLPELSELADNTPVEDSAPVVMAPASNVLDFDLRGLVLEETAQPSVPVEEPKAETGPIDFDVLLPEVPVAPPEPKAEAGPIDFDFLLPEIPAMETAPALAAATPSEPLTETGLIDLEFLLPETPANAKAEVTPPSAKPS